MIKVTRAGTARGLPRPRSFSQHHRRRVLIGAFAVAVTVCLAGCGSRNAPAPVNPIGTHSSTPSHTPSPLKAADVAVVQADSQFWQAYADDDTEGACSDAFAAIRPWRRALVQRRLNLLPPNVRALYATR